MHSYNNSKLEALNLQQPLVLVLNCVGMHLPMYTDTYVLVNSNRTIQNTLFLKIWFSVASFKSGEP